MKRYARIMSGTVIVFAIAGIGAGLYLFNMKPKNLARIKPDFTFSASGLQKAFEDNEKAAALKYVNKIIEVSGEILSVKKGENNSVNVALKTGNVISAVICTFPSGNDPGNITVGNTVKIKGVCSGYLMDVLLNNCAMAVKQ